MMTMGEEGFEPPTPWFVATCSSPLSYTPMSLDLIIPYPSNIASLQSRSFDASRKKKQLMEKEKTIDRVSTLGRGDMES
jgi:hypothetical protein